MEDNLRQAVEQISAIDAKALESARARLADLAEEAAEMDRRMGERDQRFAEEMERRRTEIDAEHARFTEQLVAQMAALDAEVATRRSSHEEQSRALADHSLSIAAQLETYGGRMAEIVRFGSQAEVTIAESLSLLAEKLVASRSALGGTGEQINRLTDDSVRLLELIQASVQHTSTDLPTAMGISEAKLAEIEQRTQDLRRALEAAEGHGEAVSTHVERTGGELAAALTKVEQLQAALREQAASQGQAINDLQQGLDGLHARGSAVAEQAQGELREAIAALQDAASQAVAGIETMSAAAVRTLAERIGQESGDAIEAAMRARAAEVAGQLEQATSHAAGISREATIQLRDQLAKVNELAGNLERRVAQARQRAEEQVDNDFARRVALITEALNSNAIDIARAMDADVSDSAWAAYLRGDRGVFTRRAVKLLENPEAKAVTQLYENDDTFRIHVSRYIHDFEAMLRQLLSTRDGHALGVTLLSSDMGKLYVALAQAIERLRK